MPVAHTPSSPEPRNQGLFSELAERASKCVENNPFNTVVQRFRGGAEGSVVTAQPTQEPVSYPIAVAASGPQKVEAKRFVQYVLSAQGQGVLNKYGFKKP